MPHTIKQIHADEILDSRGNPTLRVRVVLKNGIIGVASVPSGASTGAHEALELRDNDKRRYGGRGVLKARNIVQGPIAKALCKMSVHKQREIDDIMVLLDGTDNKRKFGANAILGVSLACARAGALCKKQPLYEYIRKIYKLQLKEYLLPRQMMNVLNGGAHANFATDVQEFMIVPQQSSVRERVRCGSEVFHALGKLVAKRGVLPLVGDEGGFALKFSKNEQALALLVSAVKSAGYKLGKDVKFALDVAASELYDKRTGAYKFRSEKKTASAKNMIDMFASWIKKYPIISIEDPLDQDAFGDWRECTKKLGSRAMIVGDDLFVTQVARIKRGIDERVANAVLIKPNQVGTLSETIDAILLARANGYKIIVSHRSGETADTTIADLAVAVNADYIKTGSLSRLERVEKYNRLMEIEDGLKKRG
ncbi:MAG: hypothetical protein ACD_76C00018G0005 [uncultured bacterium]|nr:MAG: hypothetical protein ACD_76C00018G0005 [uncultured bacterium]HBD05035.1 phosphopyruvate hydratase [Candidatus Uhrbacteria bacterium]